MKHHHHQQTFCPSQSSDLDWDGIVIVAGCVWLLAIAALGVWWLG
jgi:hypothetical protein